MARMIGRGWSDLYKIVSTKGRECLKKGRWYMILTEYAGVPLRDPENPSYYAVNLRCGWGRTMIPHFGGTVGGLTYEQWLFIHNSVPKLKAILAVGPNWPGLEEAIKRARKAGVEVYL